MNLLQDLQELTPCQVVEYLVKLVSALTSQVTRRHVRSDARREASAALQRDQR